MHIKILWISEKGEFYQWGGWDLVDKRERERELIENCQYLDISFISKNKWTFYPIHAFIDNENDKEFLFLDYSINWFRLKLDFVDKMEVATTYPHFGGCRKWIICNGCGKGSESYIDRNQKHFSSVGIAII